MCRSDNHGGHYHGGKAAARALIACKKLRVLKCNDLTFGERGGLEVAHGLKNGCPLLEILDGMNNVRVLNHFCNDSFSFSVLRISTSFKNVFVLVRVVTYILVLVAGGWWLVAVTLALPRALICTPLTPILPPASYATVGVHSKGSNSDGRGTRGEGAVAVGMLALQLLWRGSNRDADAGLG